MSGQALQISPGRKRYDMWRECDQWTFFVCAPININDSSCWSELLINRKNNCVVFFFCFFLREVWSIVCIILQFQRSVDLDNWEKRDGFLPESNGFVNYYCLLLLRCGGSLLPSLLRRMKQQFFSQNSCNILSFHRANLLRICISN